MKNKNSPFFIDSPYDISLHFSLTEEALTSGSLHD